MYLEKKKPMRHLKVSLLLLAVLGTCQLSGQLTGQALTDSLLAKLPLQKEDTNKVNVLNRLAILYVYNNSEEALKYAQAAVKLSEKIGIKAKIQASYYKMGMCHQAKGDQATALACFEKSLKISEETGDKSAQSDNWQCIAASYFYKSDYSNANVAAEKSLKIAEVVGRKSSIANASTLLGVINAKRGNYPKALEYFYEMQKLYDEIGDKGGMITAMVNIGNVLNTQGQFEKALDYYQKTRIAARELNRKQTEAIAVMNIAGVYGEKMQDHAKAIEFYTLSIKLNEEIGDKNKIAHATSNLSGEYLAQKEYALALENCHKAAALAKEIGAKATWSASLTYLGMVYVALAKDPALSSKNITLSKDNTTGNYKAEAALPKGRAALLAAAIEQGEHALALAKEIDDKARLLTNYELLTEAYMLSGNYKKALDASDNLHAMKDSVYSQEGKEDILKISMKNDYDRQRLTDSLKAAEKQKIASINLQKQKNYTYMGVAGILLLAVFSFFIVKERGKSEKARKQSDELLLNILPGEVASELKTTGTTTAKHYDNVTVLFTDFVNFTQAGENMSPQNLIDELHSCFKAFDEIADKYNIEKIKTIGDAYLAVAGLPTADPKHAENVIKAAKEITAFMENRLGKMGTERTFQIRVGIHSGSVVAGIVGVKKFAYDIWGDTVNTAARMEQNSEAGKINISQTTYELVKDKFPCEYRGEVEAKGKGVMRMYFVG
jgi:adenylate cyclase